MARRFLAERFADNGRTIQFHPSTTYESFVTGLAPALSQAELGLRFETKRGHLVEAVAAAAGGPDRPYLLHIDEINRADLAKVLGEAIYLLEPDDPGRAVTLPFDNGAPVGRELRLPPNLYLLGTMNSADRSIAILDLAVRRRFAFVPLWPDRAVLEECGASPRMVEAFERLLELFLEQAGDEALPLIPGHAYFLETGAGTRR